jgi:NAD(P)-dependent dehydrogenase (short-subunit alcohol dehydrogenase family)
MNESFNNKVALITGAASGIGFAVARAFADAGASVALVDLNQEALIKAAGRLDIGERALAIGCDVTQEAQVAAMVTKTVAKFGRLDAAFNSAGIHVPVSNTADASTDDFDRLMAINLRGTWLCMKHELKQCKSSVTVQSSTARPKVVWPQHPDSARTWLPSMGS